MVLENFFKKFSDLSLFIGLNKISPFFTFYFGSFSSRSGWGCPGGLDFWRLFSGSKYCFCINLFFSRRAWSRFVGTTEKGRAPAGWAAGGRAPPPLVGVAAGRGKTAVGVGGWSAVFAADKCPKTSGGRTGGQRSGHEHTTEEGRAPAGWAAGGGRPLASRARPKRGLGAGRRRAPRSEGVKRLPSPRDRNEAESKRKIIQRYRPRHQIGGHGGPYRGLFRARSGVKGPSDEGAAKRLSEAAPERRPAP